MANENTNDLREMVIELRVEMRQMRETMAKVALSLDKLAIIESHALTLHSELKDHEQRIRGLEHGFWKATGIATAMAMVAGWVSTKFFGG